MLDWLKDNHQIASLLINLGMLIVWIVYLQLFLAGYKRQTRSKILINIGAGHRLDARCLISNMGSNAIYLESLIAGLELDRERLVCAVTDVQELTSGGALSDTREATIQGPLMPGAMADVGSFRDLIRRAATRFECPADAEEGLPEGLRALEIQAIADFGPDDLLVGAKRRFQLVERGGSWFVKTGTPSTEQIRSRRERKKVRRILAEVDP
jgi:hypothetical protein